MDCLSRCAVNDDDRGKIRNRDRAKQLKDFSGLRFGRITPTDIDGFVDFQNKAFVIFEIKYGATEVPRGQELCYERLALACEKAGVKTLVLVATHDVEPPGDIDVAGLRVTKVFFQGKWRPPKCYHTVRTAFDSFREWVNKDWDY